jgi:hypothetical protein
MNEQIKELARKAGISILYEYDGYDGHAGVANFDDIEKFAELIVKECEKVIRAQNKSFNVIDEWDRGYALGLESATGAIKEHFGVDE